MTEERSDARVLRLIAEVVAGLAVPYSLSMEATRGRPEVHLGTAARAWVELRDELHLFGWSRPEEVAAALKCALEAPIPDGWKRCDCDEAGKWGAGVDRRNYTKWTRRHDWHRASLSHGFLIHEVEPIPKHDEQMPHWVGKTDEHGCPPNCPFRLAVEWYRREER